ncbi:MAG: helix-turn-helix domain-containing protein [Gemmatimonadetes bacterium]|nr:helix-turn-helix domain-containing protein [Gemmatimonadota bacterium]
MTEQKLLTATQAMKEIGCGSSTFYRLCRDPNFPKAITANGGKFRRWNRREILKWMRESA